MSSPRVINLRLFLAHAWCRELLPGIAQYAREWGDIELRCTEGLAPLTPDMAKRYTGLIGAFGTDDLTALDSYHDHGIPVVSISEHQVAEGLPVAGHDNYEIGRMAAEHLMAKRIHTFAYVPIESARLNSERHLGFSETVQAAGHKEPSVLLGQQDSDILRNASKPLGVFAFNDLRARHVYDIARGLDLSIPSEVSIIGVDNDPVVCELGSVTLSSVAPNFPGVGYRAAQLLHQLSEGTTQRMEAPRVRPLGLKERLSTNRLLVEDELVRRAITLINKDLKNPLTVTSIAAALGVSPRHLQYRFAAAVGVGVAAQVRRCRLERAAHLLEDTNLRVAEVADQVGVPDINRFSRYFRMQYGLAPSKYRKDVAVDPIQ